MTKHITSFFRQKFEEDTTLTITRTSPSYSFFISEFKNGLSRDPNGNLLIRKEKERLIKLRKYVSQIISMGSDAYSYYLNEYRQNSPVQDMNGNIILNEEIVEQEQKSIRSR